MHSQLSCFLNFLKIFQVLQRFRNNTKTVNFSINLNTLSSDSDL